MRRVYFSFDYQRDLYRVGKIYQLPNAVSRSAAGFQNATVWQEAARRGEAAVQGLIDDALINTSVTVVCIGSRTAYGRYLGYELERSLERGNGLVGIRVNRLRDQDGLVDKEAPVPPLIEAAGFHVYSYTDKSQLVAHIEEAAELAKQNP